MWASTETLDRKTRRLPVVQLQGERRGIVDVQDEQPTDQRAKQHRDD
jgi:hypothetical protein